jgi:hypothetical protein
VVAVVTRQRGVSISDRPFSGPRADSVRELDLLSWQAHDFGVLLAHGQTLTHNFTLRNPRKLPIRLVRGKPFTPCCSAIGPLPKLVPANGSAEVQVTLRPGLQSGAKQAEFEIQTDDEDGLSYKLAVTAYFVPAWQVDRQDGSDWSLLPGQSGKKVFRLTVRSNGTDGYKLPSLVSCAKPIEVSYRGAATELTDPGGLTVATRDIIVSLPAEDRTGTRTAEIIFNWPDGHNERQAIAWEIRPRLKISPSALILQPSSEPVEKSFTVQSESTLFRVTNVRCSVMISETHSAQREHKHVVRVKLDLSKTLPQRAVSIAISTDLPDREGATATIMVLGNGAPRDSEESCDEKE